MRRLLAPALVALTLLAPAAHAVQPDEILPDPALEARARTLSQNLRCLVCRNENIDDSNAPLARDLRILLRERLTAGDSDEQAVAYLVDRYGEYVLLKPTAHGANLLLWIAGPAMLLVGVGIAAAAQSRRRKVADAPTSAASLSAEEERRLAELMKE